MKKLLASFDGFLVFLLVLVLALVLGTQGGCVGKPGAEVVSDGGKLSSIDPSNEHSTVVLAESTTTASGPGATETSSMTKGKLQETNGGSALKQRAAFAIGDLQAMLSAGADFDMAGIEVGFAEGKVTGIKIKKLATSTSAVQKAFNEGVAARVTAWVKGSDNEKAVLMKQLEVQKALGDKVAEAALEVILGLATGGASTAAGAVGAGVNAVAK